MAKPLKITRVLISLSDKRGLLGLAKLLTKLNCELLATSGSRAYLQEHAIKATSIEAWSGMKELFSGRVKTLNYKIQGGLLYDRDDPQHCTQAAQQGILPIDCVLCNFYPLVKNEQFFSKSSRDNRRSG